MPASRRALACLAIVLPAAGGCAHVGPGPAAPIPEPERRLAAEAAAIGRIEFEEDYNPARWVYQALPREAAPRARLRARLLEYLLGPLRRLEPEALRKEASEVAGDDVEDRIFASFREALDALAAPEIAAGLPDLTARERELLEHAARLVLGLFSPRGADVEVATSLAVLQALEPAAPEWESRLGLLLRWSEESSRAGPQAQPGKRPNTPIDVLESVAAAFPSLRITERLAGLYLERQAEFLRVLRQPVGGGESARRALGDLLLAHGEEMQRAAYNLTAAFLRVERLDRAVAVSEQVAGQAGDDPDLRRLAAAAARPRASAADLLALARRFLPRVKLLEGTAPDAPDPALAGRVIEMACRRFPGDPDVLALAGRVARLNAAPFLAVRRFEEAKALLERQPAAAALPAVSRELLDLYFVRLRLLLDPERPDPADAAADSLRRLSADTLRRFPSSDLQGLDAGIDFQLARNYVNAGLVDRAESLFLRAESGGQSAADVAFELASLSVKRGNPARAIDLLEDGLRKLRKQAPPEETIGSVEAESKLGRLLGDARDLLGDRARAEAAWRGALAGWERLMVEHLRRKDARPAAEAMIEVGRLAYELGHRGEGLQRFSEALDQDEDRDQSYIDILAFLVEHGEVDAAVATYRRALSRPDSRVSEYVKVYASLWIADLTRRSSQTADRAAETFLRTLDLRHGDLRPSRSAVWYRQLARYATGRSTYQDLLAVADTPGKRAEIYFYEAMRRLADGRVADANDLWRKVIETHMFSFFEFDMASQYLRSGAPAHPAGERPANVETI